MEERPGVSGPDSRQPVVIDASQLPEVADALSDAFYDDPVMSWILAEETSRRRRLAGMFSVLMRAHYVPMNTAWTTADHAGAALWAAPGRAVVPLPTMVRNSPSLVRALGRRTLTALRALTHVERLHPKEPHWYLGVLGTRTALQGKGVGSALLGPALGICDEQGLPAYLESSKHSNIAFYERHGFKLTGEIQLPLGGPVVWPMWREPRPPEDHGH